MSVADKWLEFPFRTPEVTGSNLGLKTDCPEVFRIFLTASRQIPGYLKFGGGRFLTNHF
jgi:hypothetical protein